MATMDRPELILTLALDAMLTTCTYVQIVAILAATVALNASLLRMGRVASARMANAATNAVTIANVPSAIQALGMRTRAVPVHALS